MNKRSIRTSSIVSFTTSILAFLGIISCCGFPVIAAFLALFGIGASQLHFLSEYQSVFSSIAILSLVYGFYIIYFKKPKSNNATSCNSDITDGNSISSTCCQPNSKTNGFAKTILWIAAIMVFATFFINEEDNKTNQESNCCISTTIEQNTKQKQESSCCSKPISNTGEESKITKK